MNPTVTLEDVYSPIDQKLERVPSAILEILATPNELADEAIKHFFSSQGKLLRPALTLLGAELKGIDSSLGERALKLAASYEIFHSATLVHDDIIDSAFLRRSIPTINTKWNSQVAVLVGDYLHDKAIRAIFQNGNEAILNLFLETAGLVCDGEIHELHIKGNLNLSEAEYFQIIEKKTSVLLACCVEAGARLAGATDQEAAALKRFGIHFGNAFQIVDDCLDFTGNEMEFGKTLGKDCMEGVLTLPLIRLLQTANPAQKKEILATFGSSEDSSKYQTLLTMIKESGTLDYAVKCARDFAAKASRELSIFPNSPARRSLEKLVDYVIERNK